MIMEEIINWLNSREGMAIVGAFGIVGGLGVIFGMVRWVWQRGKNQHIEIEVANEILTRAEPAPRTLWEYLTNDLKLTPKQREVCASLYDIGHEQLVQPSNNREERIEEFNHQLQEQAQLLTAGELEEANRLGIQLGDEGDNPAEETVSLISRMPPAPQNYARTRALVRRIEWDKALDLSLNVPLTDFREVKAALKNNTPPIEVIDQLPLAWKMIRTIHDPIPKRRASIQATSSQSNWI